MRVKTRTLDSHLLEESLAWGYWFTTLKRAMQEIIMRGSEIMDYRKVMLIAAADCFSNHRGEEFTLRQLGEKYSPKAKSSEKIKKSK